ncbi:hypothetical protein IE077_001187, partial [Cardiosporidium cionae]
MMIMKLRYEEMPSYFPLAARNTRTNLVCSAYDVRKYMLEWRCNSVDEYTRNDCSAAERLKRVRAFHFTDFLGAFATSIAETSNLYLHSVTVLRSGFCEFYLSNSRSDRNTRKHCVSCFWLYCFYVEIASSVPTVTLLRAFVCPWDFPLSRLLLCFLGLIWEAIFGNLSRVGESKAKTKLIASIITADELRMNENTYHSLSISSPNEGGLPSDAAVSDRSTSQSYFFPSILSSQRDTSTSYEDKTRYRNIYVTLVSVGILGLFVSIAVGSIFDTFIFLVFGNENKWVGYIEGAGGITILIVAIPVGIAVDFWDPSEIGVSASGAIFTDSLRQSERIKFFTRRGIVGAFAYSTGPLLSWIYFAFFGDEWKLSIVRVPLTLAIIVFGPLGSLILLLYRNVLPHTVNAEQFHDVHE